MNWVLIVVLATLALGVASGWRRGFLRIVYSLISWAVVLVFVSWSTPYLRDYLMEHTSLYDTIQRQCEETIGQAVGRGETGEPRDAGDGNGSGSVGYSPGGETGEPQDAGEAGAELARLGISLPEAVAEDIFENITDAADAFLAESGFYEALSKEIAYFAVEGIAYLAALTGAWLLVQVISRILGIVSHIPVISGLNRFLGLFAGGLYGLILVWIAFYIAALCSASGPGAAVIAEIRQNAFLTFLYERNLLLLLFLRRF